MTHTTRSPLGWLLAALGLLAAPALAPAQSETFWIPQTGGNWFTPANWDNGLPNAPQAWARFGWSGPGSQTVNVDGTATVGRMTFGFLGNESSTSEFAYTLSGGTIILDNGVSAALIERSKTDGDTVIQTPLTIAGNNALILNNGGFTNGPALNTLTIGSLSGTHSAVTINAAGTNFPGVVVIQSGNYGGVTEVRGGVLRDEGVGLPANTSLRLNGGIWEMTQATTITRSLGTAAGNIQLLGVAGFSALDAGGTLRVQLNGGTGQVQWGSANFNPTTLGFGRNASAANEVYSFENAIDLNGATRTIGAANKALVSLGGVISNSSATAAGVTIARFANGAGTVVLSGSNTYTGPTTVQLGAVLRARVGVGLPAASNLVLNGGTLEYLDAGSFNRATGTGAGQIRVFGASGFAAWGGVFTVQLGSSPVVWGSANFNPSIFQFGSPNANGLVDFQTGIDLNGGGRFLSYWDRSPSTTDQALISGVISNSTGTGPLFVGGNGTITLSGANTYNGETVVVDVAALPGTVLKLAGSGSFANSPRVTVGAGRFLDVTGLTGGANYNAGAGRFMLAGGQTLAGSGTVVGNVLVGPLATIRGGSPPDALNEPTGQLVVNGSLRLIGGTTVSGSTLAVDLNGASATGATVSRVAVIGAGNTWDFAPVAGDPVTIQLLNDQNLTANQPYSYVIGSSAGGFTRNGVASTSFAYGTDFDLVSSNFQVFTDVTLTVDGSNNLVLGLTPLPVPEPAAVLAIGAAALTLLRSRRKGKRKEGTSE